MKFNDRREFLYDPSVFRLSDVTTALKIHDEYVRRCSGRPCPKFFEVDRSTSAIDPLWHQPKSDRTQFTRELDIPSIVQFDKLDWRVVRLGRIPQQNVKMWVSNLGLQAVDYFPLQGDRALWNGYRLEITGIEFEPTSFWQQTNVWLGLICTAVIVPDGDLKPLANPTVVAPVEVSPGAEMPFKVVVADSTKLGSDALPSADYPRTP